MNIIPSKAFKILITAGPTIEHIDPVRYISNRSTGIMGYGIAAECIKRGHKVSLVSGPVSLIPPDGADVVRVHTAEEMKKEVETRIEGADCIIMTAAVCDFKPVKQEQQKIKKKDRITLELVKNPDILKSLTAEKDIVKIGFALETENAMEYGYEKLKDKELDMIVINRKTQDQDPFGHGVKQFTIMTSGGDTFDVEGITKEEFAKVLVKKAEKLLG